MADKYPEDFAANLKDFDELTIRLAYNRGLRNENEIRSFINPDYDKDVYDPFLLKDMDKAVSRILKAIEKKEKIAVFGDYDADGVCSSTILAIFFKAIGYENFFVYNPDRYKEGYGLTAKSMDELFRQGAEFIITIDNGINSIEAIESINDKGKEVVIIDHHLTQDKLPPAYAVVDPKRADDSYPDDMLCATALGFKVVTAILQKNRFSLVAGWEKWLLDLVAIASIADMVPLQKENRVLTYWGIQVLKKTRRLGLKAMAKSAGLDISSVTADDIAFTVSPRINVAGRMDNATLAGELLTTDSKEEAEWLASQLEEKNNERKVSVEEIVREVKLNIPIDDTRPLIVYGSLDWRSGGLGIAANRLVEEYLRPVLLWGRADSEVIRGSARSDGTINMVELLKGADTDLITEFGGHSRAAGFSLRKHDPDKIEASLLDSFKKLPKGENVYEEIIIERELNLDDVTLNTFSLISKFEPYGQGNPKPNFLFKNTPVKSVRTFGNGGTHLELSFLNSNNENINAVGFFSAKSLPEIKSGDKIDLVGALDWSKYRGHEELRLKIVDFKLV